MAGSRLRRRTPAGCCGFGERRLGSLAPCNWYFINEIQSNTLPLSCLVTTSFGFALGASSFSAFGLRVGALGIAMTFLLLTVRVEALDCVLSCFLSVPRLMVLTCLAILGPLLGLRLLWDDAIRFALSCQVFRRCFIRI